MNAFYNEIDPFACRWLGNLIAAGHIAPGTVCERSISDLSPTDLDGFGQCHFFAGIGVWSYALRLAGWPDGAPVWTGSCPCQPFSAEGQRRGHTDARHLWPAWFRLISERRPCVVFGEQVASRGGLVWVDAVQADLEAEGYAVGALDLCAASVGAPHRRQRIFFVAYDHEAGRDHIEAARLHDLRPSGHDADGRGESGGLGNSDSAGPQGRIGRRHGANECVAGPTSVDGSMADAEHDAGWTDEQKQRAQRGVVNRGVGFWSDAEWILCRDGKARPVEPGTFPLAHGATARVGRLRAYGNAIVAPLAAEFIRATMKELSR